MVDIHVPPYQSMMNPIIDVLKQLGGSATIEELNSMVVERMQFSDDQLSVPHNPDKGSLTEIEYRLAWARTYLKKFGILENSSRGVWALTAKGRESEEVDTQVVRRFVAEQSRQQREPNNVSVRGNHSCQGR
ncbi:MAG: winged helix-turn-helix domain-containing protein [Planctomycetota bacterium]|nr:winged helix-turn-helix domain-containing protein [Planctomycetota bacterium]